MPVIVLTSRLLCHIRQLFIKKLLASQGEALAANSNFAGKLFYGRAMMTMLAMTAILIGAMLGLRFTAPILARAFVIGPAAALVVGLAYSDSLWSILLAMVLTITALQMGYLGGAAIRFIIEGDVYPQDFATEHRGLATGPLAEHTLVLVQRVPQAGRPSSGSL
jgi:hypothetical protein